MDEKEYNMKIFTKVSELIKEIDFKHDPSLPVSYDQSLADNVFDAGMELAIDVGAYCLDTKRVIKFTEQEIKDRLKEIPREIIIGEGKDSRTVIARRPNDMNMPIIVGGGVGPFEEHLHIPFYKLISLLPIDAFESCNIYTIAGRRIVDPPLLVWTTKKIVEWLREGIRQAGKPGLHISSYPLLTRSDVILGVMGPSHIRTTDCVSTIPMPELYKFQYDTFTAAQMAHDYGCFVNEANNGVIGGFAGSPEGAAIECVGSQLLGAMVNRPDYALCFLFNSLDVDMGLNDPKKRWAESLMMQAVSRNTNMKIEMSVTSAAEPGTEQALLERVIPLLHCRSRGCSLVLFLGRPARPKRLNLGSPIEVKWSIDVMKSVYSLSETEANEILVKLYSLIPKENFKTPPRGLSFDEGYDENFEPKKIYLDVYEKARKKILELGLIIDKY